MNTSQPAKRRCSRFLRLAHRFGAYSSVQCAGTAHRALVEDLFARLDGVPVQDAPSALDELLTERELAVLRYLPTSLSTADIASEMFVSPNTVKTHIRHIYGKLGAGRRADAVRRARDRGLIGKALALTGSGVGGGTTPKEPTAEGS